MVIMRTSNSRASTMTLAIKSKEANQSTGLITLHELLVMLDVKYDVLQTAIDRFGICTMSSKGPRVHEPFDKQALQSMCFLDDYARCNDPFSVTHWGAEKIKAEGGDDFGWPSFLLPDFISIEKELRPVFITISKLLNQKSPIAHTSIALEVESHGVWKMERAKGFVKYSADSQIAVEALTGLSIDLLHQRHPPPQDYLDWYQEEDPLYWLGWPEAQLPKFKTSDEEHWTETFHRLEVRGALFRHDMVTVGRLIFTGRATTGLIKTAIEKFGIYGLDDHGRLTKYRNEHDQVRVLDKSLADLAFIFNNNIAAYDELFEGPEFVAFGWPREHLPDFEALKNEPIPEAAFPTQAAALQVEPTTAPSTSSVWKNPPTDIEQQTILSDRDESAYITVIAGLLWFIQGKNTTHKHPDYKGQNALIDNFERTLVKLHRAKQRNIKDKFSKANKLIGLLQPPMTVASPPQPEDEDPK